MALNIENIKNQISNLLSPYANKMEDERLGVFLALSIGRVLVNTYHKENKLIHINNEQIDSITNWLMSSIQNNASWISNLDDQRRPKKLMKFSSVDGILQEVMKTHNKEKQTDLTNKIILEGEELYESIDEGYHIVKLTTPKALRQESHQMQHCIGNGVYDDYLQKEGHLFLSLRDHHSKSHATFEIRDNTLTQLQGKQNKPVVSKYIDILANFIKDKDYKIDVSAHNLGYVRDIKGDWHNIFSLPENLAVDNLNLIESTITELPGKLTVLGNLHLTKSKITTLPDGIQIGGSLYYSNTNIVSLPDDLHVKGNFYLLDSTIEKFGKNLTVDKNLYLNDSKNQALPEGLKVYGNLHMSNTKITELPEDIYVGGNINFAGSHIQKLPNNFHVYGDLNLTRSDIIYLPDNFCVEGSLSLRDTALTELPVGLKVGEILQIVDTKIISLPDDLQVKNIIFLPDTWDGIIPSSLNENVVLMRDQKPPTTVKNYKNNVQQQLSVLTF